MDGDETTKVLELRAIAVRSWCSQIFPLSLVLTVDTGWSTDRVVEIFRPRVYGVHGTKGNM